jgi:hypothetical protein
MKISSLKYRLLLWFIGTLALAVTIFSVGSYIVIAQRIYRPFSPPSINFDVVTLVRSSSQGIAGESEYSEIMSYPLSAELLQKIQSSPQNMVTIGTPEGLISFDQKKFITADVVAPQTVQIYGRPSPTNSNDYDLVVILQPDHSNETMGIVARVFLFCAPAVLLVAGASGFWVLNRIFVSVDRDLRSSQNVEGEDNEW